NDASQGSANALPASMDGFYNAGSVVSVSGQANTGFVFDHFSGDLGGTTNPQSLTMNAAHTVTAVFAPAAAVTSPLATVPAGLNVIVDCTAPSGCPVTPTPATVHWVPGTPHTLSVPSPQVAMGGGMQRVFQGWNISMAKDVSLTAPTTATTYTA